MLEVLSTLPLTVALRITIPPLTYLSKEEVSHDEIYCLKKECVVRPPNGVNTVSMASRPKFVGGFVFVCQDRISPGSLFIP